MTLEKYIMVGITSGFVSGFISCIGSTLLTIHNERPQIAYEKRIEGDKREYLVIESINGRKSPMVRTAQNEPFKRLEKVFEDTLASEKTKLQGLREKVLSEE
ncbi:MAG: hypothetical protein ABIG37_02815 [Nanoarchaeota archaeon]|nr:hypothetical protein [Nanoarchaeota archaeon]